MKCPNPIYIRATETSGSRTVPCGKCAACRKRIAGQWVTRLEVEFKHASSCYFVTLTYNEQNVPYTKSGQQTLKKSDLQEFLNLLKQYAPYRHFSIGEYGDKGARPHYHLILFNFNPIVNPATGNIVYHRSWGRITSDMLMSNVDIEAVIFKAWKKGIVQIEPLDGGAINYVANYTVDYSVRSETEDQQKIFALMTRKPPIGYQYYSDSQIHRYHNMSDFREKSFYQTNYGRTVLPRLYKDKLYSKPRKEAIQEHIKRKEDKIKHSKLFSKNFYESHANLNDILNKRNQKRKL